MLALILALSLVTSSSLSTGQVKIGEHNVQLEAPVSWWHLPPGRKRELVNGCGPDHTDAFFTTALGASLTEACDIHDYMYYLGTTERDRAVADAVLRRNVRSIYRAQGMTSTLQAGVVDTVVAACRVLGWMFFKYKK